MTHSELRQEIERLSGKATAGPWQWEDWTEDDGPNKQTLAAPSYARPGGPAKSFPTLGQPIFCADEPIENQFDADLIVLLRNNVPLILEALAKMEGK
jgi:hypothetical protein